jgi:hypothetical protein
MDDSVLVSAHENSLVKRRPTRGLLWISTWPDQHNVERTKKEVAAVDAESMRIEQEIQRPRFNKNQESVPM